MTYCVWSTVEWLAIALSRVKQLFQAFLAQTPVLLGAVGAGAWLGGIEGVAIAVAIAFTLSRPVGAWWVLRGSPVSLASLIQRTATPLLLSAVCAAGASGVADLLAESHHLVRFGAGVGAGGVAGLLALVAIPVLRREATEYLAFARTTFGGRA
jgi:hypothetical protein